MHNLCLYSISSAYILNLDKLQIFDHTLVKDQNVITPLVNILKG